MVLRQEFYCRFTLGIWQGEPCIVPLLAHGSRTIQITTLIGYKNYEAQVKDKDEFPKYLYYYANRSDTECIICTKNLKHV